MTPGANCLLELLCIVGGGCVCTHRVAVCLGGAYLLLTLNCVACRNSRLQDFGQISANVEIHYCQRSQNNFDTPS